MVERSQQDPAQGRDSSVRLPRDDGDRPGSVGAGSVSQQSGGSTKSGSQSATAGSPAWFRGKGLFWWPWPFLLALDLWSKGAVFAWMAGRYGPVQTNPHHTVFESAPLTFELVTWENPGTIWGLFQDSTVPLIVLRCAAVVGLLWFVRVTRDRSRWQLLLLSLIFAGALGNLYDNLTRIDALQPRSVRDFLRFSSEWPVAWGFPAFNVADSCITVGAIGLLILLLREDRLAAKARKKVSS